ncbi:PREDICTED: BUD13 homolog [Ceratosolen solmsi marchali]|uniref:BUD13 homolog n=1 Tax=Ceratosolen solmsi marchali TaxID=326594 RepID=A0AAJ7DY26_9HYME|nr:PREDICTED: BUD13 homolog [Ceratosolen solmsi marchali]
MEDVKINQKEYLKKYLSKKDDGKKKKKRKIKVGVKTVQIIDDDIDLKKLIPVDDDEISIFNTTEDAPQIVGIIDERGPIDFADKQRWKVIADDGTGDIQIKKVEQFKRVMQDNNDYNDITSKKKSLAKKTKTDKNNLKRKSSAKKKKKRSNRSSSSSGAESDCKVNRKSGKKKTKKTSKKRKKNKKHDSSSIDSSSDSDSDSDSSLETDSDISVSRSMKKKKKLSKKKKESNDSDLSPPRRINTDKLSNRKRKNSDSDLSPPRSRKDMKKLLNNEMPSSDSDISPPRSNKTTEILDRRKINDSDHHEYFNKYNEFDVHAEPVRKRSKIENKIDLDQNTDKISKSRYNKNSDKYDSDLSPPRHSKSKYSKNLDKYDSDLNPPRHSESKHNRNLDKYDSDLSPSKNSKSKNGRRSDKYDSDLSPPRNTESKNDRRPDKYDSDLSPQRSSRHDKHIDKYNSNHSQQRNSNSQYTYLQRNEANYSSQRKYSSKYSKDSSKRDSNLSPQRNYSNQRPKVSRWDEEKKPSSKEKHKKENRKIKKTLDGTSAGLQNLKSLKEEEEAQKKREAEMMKNMGREVSGYGQTTIVRDKRTGRKRDLGKEAADRREKQKTQDEINEKYSKWGKGLKQMADKNDKLKSDLHEMNKPLARYADDEDLDRELRARDRDDDPMLAYIKEKEIKEGKRAPEKPKYEGSYMPNRFGIKPGYRWDGVDRSNGYEKKWFEARNTKKAIEEEAYKWSTADM